MSGGRGSEGTGREERRGVSGAGREGRRGVRGAGREGRRDREERLEGRN